MKAEPDDSSNLERFIVEQGS